MVWSGLLRPGLHSCWGSLGADRCEPNRGPAEDLRLTSLRARIELLVSQGAFLAVGGSFPCSSLSRANRPALRSGAFPRGKPGISPSTFAKVQADNHSAEWASQLRALCISKNILHWFCQIPPFCGACLAGKTVCPRAPTTFRPVWLPVEKTQLWPGRGSPPLPIFSPASSLSRPCS